MGDGTASPIAGGKILELLPLATAAGHTENLSFRDRQTKEFSEFAKFTEKIIDFRKMY